MGYCYFSHLCLRHLLVVTVIHLLLLCQGGLGLVEIRAHARTGLAWSQTQPKLLTSPTGRTADVVTEVPWYFPQLIDHFTNSTALPNQFLQRYWINSKFVPSKLSPSLTEKAWANLRNLSQQPKVKAKPQNSTSLTIFLYMCGESTCLGSPKASGFVSVLASELHALVLTLEHRFYGHSIPNNDTSVSGLQYLTVEQSLADHAKFIRWVSYQLLTHLGVRTSWVVIGGSYSGALAAWFKESYPELAVAAYSSSGVVNAIVDFWQFDRRVAIAVGSTCAKVLREMVKAAEVEIFVSPEKIQKLFGITVSSKKVPYDEFLFMMADSLAMAVQYSSKSRLCQELLAAKQTKSDLVVAFANFTNSYWGPEFGRSCAYNMSCLAENLPSSWDARSWWWQFCTQFGWLQTSPPLLKSPFLRLRSDLLTLSVLWQQCLRVFGSTALPTVPDVGTFNRKYGGATAILTQAQQTIFVDLSDDPWQEASVAPASAAAAAAATKLSSPYFYIHCDDCGHCKDLGEVKPEDPLPLVHARANITAILKQWLS